MRDVALAFLLSATPVAAFAQAVTCPECRHVAPWFKGEGGFIGTVAPGATKVTFVTWCGNVSVSGEARIVGRTASLLFTYENGAACDREGDLEIAGLEDGGWYWITDARNSAVGNLISKDVVDNRTVSLTDAGAGVEMSVGKGAVFLKETSTGRVGILPNILPQPPAGSAVVCGPQKSPDSPHWYDRQAASSCMLGDGGTKIRLSGPYGPLTTSLITRPDSGSFTVHADLWLNESGSISTSTDGASIRKGWPGKTAAGQPDHDENWLDATFAVSFAAGQDPQIGNVSGAGVTMTDDGSSSSPNGRATFTIQGKSGYCQNSRRTDTITIYAAPGAGNNVVPEIAVGPDAGFTTSSLAAYAGVTQLRVAC